MYLCVANPESLRFGWKRRASFSILLLNQSGKELYRKDGNLLHYLPCIYQIVEEINLILISLVFCLTEPFCQLFCAQFTLMGWPKAVPLQTLEEKGFLENNQLIVNVQVKVAEAVDEGYVTANEMFDVNGFQVLLSQVWLQGCVLFLF